MIKGHPQKEAVGQREKIAEREKIKKRKRRMRYNNLFSLIIIFL